MRIFLAMALATVACSSPAPSAHPTSNNALDRSNDDAGASGTVNDAGTTTTAASAPAPCSGLGSTDCAAGFECIPDSARSGAFVCAGQPGTLCTTDSGCVSGQCQTTAHDCFTPGSCDGDPSYCSAVSRGTACYSNTDCGPSYGCQDNACCGMASQECSTDADCCSGLQCHTDNTGCGIGPTPTCTIDGATYASGATNPSSPECQYCDPYLHADAWTDKGAYQRCGDSTATSYCCNGVCSSAPVCNAPGNGLDH